MAKLKAPLMSFGASGQIAKAVVYFPWKGVNAAREYVVPFNPKSQAQRDQRDLMTNALTEWHGALYTAADSIAWNRYAGILADIMSGFNAFVRTHIKEALLTNDWERMRNVDVFGAQKDRFAVQVEKTSGGNVPTVHYGTRKTFFPDSAAMGDQSGDLWGVNVVGLTEKTLYYLYVDVGTSASNYGRTGIYQIRTEAA